MIGVIADDLTGANDTAMQFIKYGLRSLVLVDFESAPQPTGDWDVIVLDTDSRSNSRKTAYKKVRKATRFLEEAGAHIFYKKIDSTLRGNIGSELDAVMDELNADISFVIPAFPATGRITLGGYQLVHGQLLENTEVAHDLLSPVKGSHVPTIIKRQTHRKVGQVGLIEIQRTLDDLSDRVDELRAKGFEILVFDAVTQGDLGRIASLHPDHHNLKVVCGPAGFAEELSKRTVSETGMPVLIVAGSLSQVTADQIKMLTLQPKTKIVELDLVGILKARDPGKHRVREVADKAIKTLSKGYDLVIRPKNPQTIYRELTKILPDLGDDLASAASKIILLMGEITHHIIKNTKISGLILTGGDTARGVCRAMKICAIAIDDEVLPGIPGGVVVGEGYERLRIVTKAGSFGEENALIEAVRFLKRRSQSEIPQNLSDKTSRRGCIKCGRSQRSE